MVTIYCKADTGKHFMYTVFSYLMLVTPFQDGHGYIHFHWGSKNLNTCPKSVSQLVSDAAGICTMISLLCKLGNSRPYHFLQQKSRILHAALTAITSQSLWNILKKQKRAELENKRGYTAFPWDRGLGLRGSYAQEENFLPGYLGAQSGSMLNLTWVPNVAVSSWLSGLHLPGRVRSADDSFIL